MRRNAPAIRFLVLVALIVSSVVGVGAPPVARAATISFVGAASAERLLGAPA